MPNRDTIQKIRADVRRRHAHNILVLFRVGDSLEAYFDDATVIHKILPGLPLENRPQGRELPLPTVCFPADRQEEYSSRLLEAGYPVHVYQARDENGNYKIEPL